MIYFISDGQYIKIGFTEKDDVIDRLNSLQIGNPKKLKVIGIIEGGREAERTLHAVFAPLRAQGEWFKIEKNLEVNIPANIQLKLNQKLSNKKSNRRSKTHALVYKAWEENPNATQQEIADSVGISRQMVGKYKKELNGYLK